MKAYGVPKANYWDDLAYCKSRYRNGRPRRVTHHRTVRGQRKAARVAGKRDIDYQLCVDCVPTADEFAEMEAERIACEQIAADYWQSYLKSLEPIDFGLYDYDSHFDDCRNDYYDEDPSSHWYGGYTYEEWYAGWDDY